MLCIFLGNFHITTISVKKLNVTNWCSFNSFSFRRWCQTAGDALCVTNSAVSFRDSAVLGLRLQSQTDPESYTTQEEFWPEEEVNQQTSKIAQNIKICQALSILQLLREQPMCKVLWYKARSWDYTAQMSRGEYRTPHLFMMRTYKIQVLHNYVRIIYCGIFEGNHYVVKTANVDRLYNSNRSDYSWKALSTINYFLFYSTEQDF